METESGSVQLLNQGIWVFLAQLLHLHLVGMGKFWMSVDCGVGH